MKPITSPLRPNDKGDNVANLQEALALFIKREVIQLSDTEHKDMERRLKQERQQKLYGEITAQLVTRFRVKFQLNDTDDVDEPTATKMNELFKELGALDEEMQYKVSGIVRDSKGKPIEGLIVRAYDKDLRREQYLGTETTTDKDGKYEVHYTPEQFTRSEKDSADLIVRVYAREGSPDKPLVESPVNFNAPPEAKIDLVLPQAAAEPSEFERYTQTLLPLITGQDVKITDLDDKDIDFLAGDSGIERQHIAWLVQAAKLSIASSSKPDVVMQTAKSAAGTNAIPVEAFYGWFRDGLSTNYADLMKHSVDELISSFLHAADQNFIPAVLRQDEQVLRTALEKRRIDDTLQPAQEGQPASLGDLLTTLPKGTVLTNNQKVAFASLYNKFGDTDTLWKEATKQEEIVDHIPTLQRTLALANLTLDHTPVIQSLQEKHNPDDPASLAYLAAIRPSEWLEVVLTHGVPPASGLTIENYADHLLQTVEYRFPTQTFCERLKQRTTQDKIYPAEKVVAFLAENKQFDLSKTPVEPFLLEQKIDDAELREGLIKAQRLQTLAASANEKIFLIEQGFTSASEIVHAGYETLKLRTGSKITKARIETLYSNAVEINTQMLAMGTLFLPRFNATPIPLLRVLYTSNVVLDKYPSVRSLFGDLDYCECRHCTSVLGPAAYLADLLHLLETLPASIGGSVLNALLARRPDLIDLDLSCENTNTEIPYIDLVLEILENAVGLPLHIDLTITPGIDIENELNAKRIPDVIKKALQRTAITIGNRFMVETSNQIPLILRSPRTSDWTITDGSRRWLVSYQPRQLVAWQAIDNELQVPIFLPTFSKLDDLIADLESGKLNSELQSVLVTESILPLVSSQITSGIKTPFGSTGWKVKLIRQVIVEVILAGDVVLLSSPAGQSIKGGRFLHGTAQVIAKELQQKKTTLVVKLFDLPEYSYQVVSDDPLPPQPKWRLSVETEVLVAEAGDSLAIAALTYQNSSILQDLKATPENRNPEAYKRLSAADAVFPWSLPFDLWLEEVRVFLAELGISRLALLDVARPYLKWTDEVIVREVLGLSKAEWDLIVSSHPTSKPWEYWGLEEQNNTIEDLSSGDNVSGTWLEVLSRVSIFLQQAGLSYRELLDILQTQFPANITAPKISLTGECQTSKMSFGKTLNAKNLDWLHRFVRLWRKLGWSVRELDLAIHILGRQINPKTLERLALLSRLQKTLNVPIQTVVAMVGGLETREWTENTLEGTPVLPSFYDSIYQRPVLRSSPDFTLFKLDDSGIELAYLHVANSQSKKLADHAEFIGASLGIKPSEVQLLIDSSRGIGLPDKLNLNTLSTLFSIASFTRALQQSIQDLVRYIKLCRINPFLSSTSPTARGKMEACLNLANQIDFVQASGFTLEELDYLLCSNKRPDSSFENIEKQLIQSIAELRSALQSGTVLQDASLDHLQQLLDQIGWPSNLIAAIGSLDQLATVLKVQIDIALPPAGTSPIIPETLSNKFFYTKNDRTAHLGCAGAVLDQDFDDLKNSLPVGITVTNVDDLELRYQIVRDILVSQVQFFKAPEFKVSLTAANATNPPHIPQDFGSFLRYDDKVPSVELIFTGLMTIGQRDFLKNVLPSLNNSFDDLNGKVTAFQSKPDDIFLEKPGARSLLLDSKTDNSSIRTALNRLVPRLELELIKSHLGPALGLEGEAIEYLLRLIKINNKTALATFTDIVFLGSDATKPIDRITFPDQVKAMIRLDKAARIFNHLKISKEQIGWLRPKGFRLLNLADLPDDNSATTSFDDWRRLVELFHLRDVLPTAQATISALLDSTSAIKAQQAFARAFELNDSDVVAACGTTLLGLIQDDHYKDPHRLLDIVQLLHVMKLLDTNSDSVQQLIHEAPNEADAMAARKLFTSRFAPQALPERLRPVSDRLRDRQRNALVDFLKAKHHLRDANALYEHYLIDVEMGACMVTSRIKQAISSVQLFVQRCLLNLEKGSGVQPSDIPSKQWRWMKNYRVWEANRKVFLYPENWIEPELRDDKSEAFRTLESDLLQGNMTNATALDALRKYLDRLNEISRLTIVNMYEESFEKKTLVHIVGRDNSQPYRHYYRCWSNPENGGTWTPWEQISVQIEGEHVMVFTLAGMVHLAWPSFSKDNEETAWKFSMNLAKRTSSGWTSLKKSSQTQEVSHPHLPNKDESTTFAFRVQPESNQQSELVKIYCFAGKPDERLLLIPMKTEDYQEDKPYKHAEYQYLSWRIRVLEEYNDLQGKLFHREMGPAEYQIEVHLGVSFIDPNHPEVPGTSPIPFLFKGENAVIGGSEALQLQFHLVRKPQLDLVDLSMESVIPIKHDVPCKITEIKIIVSPANPPLYEQTTQKATRVKDVSNLGSGHWYADVVFERKDKQSLRPSYDPDRAIELTPIATFTLRDDLSFMLDRNQAGASALGAPLSGTEHFASGYRELPESRRGGNDSLMLPQTTILTATPGRYFITTTSNQRYWAYRDDEFDIIIWLDAHDNLRVVPQGHPWIGSLRRLVREGNSELTSLPQDFQPINLNLDQSAPVDEDNSIKQVDIGFKYCLPWSVYNWEVFFHIPLLVATQLTKNQRFEEAQRWFHLIFDPTTSEQGDESVRYWKFKPFREAGRGQSIEELLQGLAKGDTSLEDEIKAWKNAPFQPHLIARMRIRAYQFTVVLKYLENLIAWGDNLFRRETIESINEATQLYILAAKILGKKPVSNPKKDMVSLSYRRLGQFGHLDAFSNVWLGFEALLAPFIQLLEWIKQHGIVGPGGNSQLDDQIHQMKEQLRSLGTLYFCVPNNENLLNFWDTVEDRLFKVRNCMNIDGVVRQLPLFEPPIDPALLVRAVAAGLELETILSDLSAPLPMYRFNIMLQKALELAGELKAMGASLLSALEKGDAEHLSLLRSSQEINLLQLVKTVREQQIKETQANLESLRKSRQTIDERYRHYQRLLGKTDIAMIAEGQVGSTEIVPLQLAKPSITEANGLGMIQSEQDQLDRLSEAQTLALISGATSGAAGVLFTIASFIPSSVPTPAGMQPNPIHDAVNAFGQALNAGATGFKTASEWAASHGSRSGIIAGYERRRNEWILQSNLAIRELAQIDKQILAAQIRADIANQELANHLKQIENAQEVNTFMQDKYTNEQLYRWMTGQISGLYFRIYQLAYDVARQAERAYQFELGLTNTSFVRYGYWDSMKKGLLSGEHLFHDLKRMEVSYLERNRREYEMTKHVSLSQLNPFVLIALRETGSCEFEIPEALFDLDFPGHYFRRLKSVSISIPCVVGPYSSVSGTLTLLASWLRPKSTSTNYNADSLEASHVPLQSIATSSGQNDSGMFELNFRDERYLPFEGAGAISRWRFTLPKDYRPFDYDTITDVVLHLRYTARDGGTPLATAATTAMKDRLNTLIETSQGEQGLVRAMSLRHEFPGEWHQILTDTTNHQGSIRLGPERFPAILAGRTITIAGISAIGSLKPLPDSRAKQTDFGKIMIDTNEQGLVRRQINGKLSSFIKTSAEISPNIQIKLVESETTTKQNLAVSLTNPGDMEDVILYLRFKIAAT